MENMTTEEYNICCSFSYDEKVAQSIKIDGIIIAITLERQVLFVWTVPVLIT